MRSYRDLMNLLYQNNEIKFQVCENISLAITKLIKTEIIENTKLKRDFLQGFTRFTNYRIFPNIRMNNFLNSLQTQGYKTVFSDSLKTQSRLIIGLGSQHVLETSITLHHIFGIPYIPASALKGVCRMVAFWKLAENKGIQNDNRELEKLQEKFYGELCKDDKEILKYQLLFGAQNFKGLLLFLDAYPKIGNNQKIFDLDIMNVHYKSYYEGKEAPGDWENPRPIVFLTLKEGIEFEFYVLFDEFRWEKVKSQYSEILKNELEELVNNNEFFEEILRSALLDFGIGSKTRLGYGLFEEI